MSRLGIAPGTRLEDLLAAAPGAAEADANMRLILVNQLGPRLFALVGVVVAGCLRCDGVVESLRGPLQSSFAAAVARDWRSAELSEAENAALAYAEKGTLDEASVRRSDVDVLRAVGFSDRDVLLLATAIAYHNYAIRMAAVFEVSPQ